MILGLSRNELEDGAKLVHEVVAPTPQLSWPLLNERAGAEVWVKHENHTAIGSFKVRGGLVLAKEIKRKDPKVAGVISATRGNHGQSVAFAGRRHGLRSVIVVPHGNSADYRNAVLTRFFPALTLFLEDNKPHETRSHCVDPPGSFLPRSQAKNWLSHAIEDVLGANQAAPLT
jgi:threonine dehydratase